LSLKRNSFRSPKFFSFILATLIVLLLWFVQYFVIFKYIDLSVLDTQFSFKVSNESTQFKKGVTQQESNLKISPDILLLGVDTNSLQRFGQWPWPRYRHADLLNTFARIADQSKRENAVLLDFFFYEPSEDPSNDALLLEALQNNGKVFLETTLEQREALGNVQVQDYERTQALLNTHGSIINVTGPWTKMLPYKNNKAPLIPLGKESAGFGHATFTPDYDKKYRSQQLVVRLSYETGEYSLDELKVGLSSDLEHFKRYGWTDIYGEDHTISHINSIAELDALKEEIQNNSPPEYLDLNNDGAADEEVYQFYEYQDYFIPSITLSLALHYFNKTFKDIEVKVGEYILIKDPQKWNSDTAAWEPYSIISKPALVSEDGSILEKAIYKTIPEIKIPVDENCGMLINYMGPATSELPEGNRTYPLRSFFGYASRPSNPDPSTWRSSMALENKIIMTGAFSLGMADDEKATPLGMMYGVEIHANALNTILMNNFLHYLPTWSQVLLLFLLAYLVAFIASRASTLWSVLITLVLIIGFFFSSTLIFNAYSIVIDFALPSFSMFLTLLAVIAYRVMTEEREKRRIQSMFGKYVSREMVNSMIESGEQPELGGVDKELTVLFSDIRGFTTLSESMSPQELVNHLNEYLTVMTDLIFKYKGTLDKYVGDEVMCFWGAPVPQEDHAFLACKCALEMMQSLKEMNEKWPPERRIDIGIGINSGIMTVGNMGSPGRLNYTLMGDNVNLGARLEGTNKAYFTHVIISEYTYGLVKDRVVVRELDNIRVKGKNKPVVIYELIDTLES